MALLEILHHPDPRLRETALPVTDIDGALQQFIDDLFETMYAAPGVGLAATQVGVAQRVAVMDCSESHDQPMVMINPQITARETLEAIEEGCLSVPGVGDKVRRYLKVNFKAQDRHGDWYEMEAEGLLAQCVQHEIDHLDGKLYIDHLSSLKRERLLRRQRKELAR